MESAVKNVFMALGENPNSFIASEAGNDGDNTQALFTKLWNFACLVRFHYEFQIYFF